MAKGPPKPKNSRSSPSSSASAHEPNTKLVLKIKSNENLRRSVRQGGVTGQRKKEYRPKSAMISKAKQKKIHKKFDKKKPKKPPTAFFYFLEDFRKEFQEQNPDIKSMRDIGKACGEKWKTMTYEEKVQYYDIATEKRAEFDKAMAEYIKRQESGEDQESEEDSEFDE
ncbi:high mobility group B protein 14 [Carica papaya]|uniref:high mobility group B protein 14 n=1 Tax=Carica papaya TaxID=3649 RepID=UPI000B8CBE9B|nr:high mobility group B protein 14 [Carica papaya]